MLTDSSPAAAALFLALPLLLTAALNLAHAAAVYLDDAALAADVNAGDRRAKTLSLLLEKNDRTRNTVQLCSYLCAALFTGAAASPAAALPPFARVLIAAAAAIVFFAVGVISPRRVAAYYPRPVAYALAGMLRFFCALLLPGALFLRAVSAAAVRLCGRDPSQEPAQVTEEEIRMLVDEGEESGAIDESEKKMINSIFEFDDRDVTEVMTHRTEVNAIPVTATLPEAVDLAMASGNTRLPVYEDGIDRICGILYAKDLLQFLTAPERFSMRGVMRAPLYVPESAHCSDVFRLMQRRRTQIAVVVDEYGGTYGIVTMEDLLETIVGSIEDEYDDEQPEARRLDADTWIFEASAGLSQAEMLLDIRFPDESEADTIGGFLTEQLGGIPRGEAPQTVRVGDVEFSVERVGDRRIDAVRAHRIGGNDAESPREAP